MARFLKIFLLFLCIFEISCQIATAEGTKELMPASTSYGRVEIYPNFSPFATYSCSPDYRLNISICNIGEQIYFGFGNTFDASQIEYNDVSFRLVAPNGNIVLGPLLTPSSGNGHISTYNQAVAGPSVINPAGYPAINYTPLTTGVYFIEFDFNDNGIERRELEYFDITVTDAANQRINGRIWSKAWQITTTISPAPNYYDNPFHGKMYVYSDDGIVTSVDFNGMRPLVFTVCANQTGCFNTGNLYFDRKSVVGYFNYPQYKIFLNEPDESCFPTGELGAITAPSYFSGCTPDDYCINIQVNQPGTVEICINLNGSPGFQAGTNDRLLVYDIVAGWNCIPFDGLDGYGNQIESNIWIPAEIVYYNGITHLPLTDVEYNENGYKVKIIRPTTPNSIPALFWDDTNLPDGNISPDGGCTNPNGCHNFYDFFGDSSTVNTWWFASNNATDDLLFQLNWITVDANINTPSGQSNDTAICYSGGTFQLDGGFENATGAYWSGGSGSFLPNNTTMNTSYMFSNQEINNGYIKLYLTTFGPEGCPASKDSIRIIIEQNSIVNAGEDKMICLNTSSVTLNGFITGNVGGMWSGGSGEFVPNQFNLSSIYYPTNEEIAAGSITLTLSSLNQICPVVSDQVTFEIVYIDIDTINDDISCYSYNDGSIQISLSGNSGGYQLIWENNYSGLTLNNLTAGNYCYTVSEQNGCEVSQCINIFEPSQLTVGISKIDVSCNDIDLGSANAIVSGGTPDYSYLWNTGATSAPLSGLSVGIYYVTVTDNNGCTATQTSNILKKGNPAVNFTVSKTSGCPPMQVFFNETTPAEYYKYIWNFGDPNSTQLLENEKNVSNIFVYEGVYDISLTVVTDEGCDSTIIMEDLITVFPDVSANFKADPEKVSILEPVIEFYNFSSENSVYYEWNFGDGVKAYSYNPHHTYKNPGEFNVSLTVFSENFCTDTAWAKIIVEEPVTLYVPTAFTPDNNGLNDIFMPKGSGIQSEGYTMYIYDRWGFVLFESSDINFGWDGRDKKGLLVKGGTYTWLIQYRDVENHDITKTGSVTVIR
ncbi:MAG: gliding motility-associated C-terminal domain-containing protein [Bacteroidia bacterium]|nr:gliding motility-associated C-terminal domain-containing protein [Bacteroidia bacterium]